MKLEFELKPTDILLLKVLSCILMAVLTLNLFVFPGLNRQSDLSAQKEEMKQEKQQVEEAIASMPATKAKIEQQQSDLAELSKEYYPQMENNDVDELVTGIALAHGLFPAALNIEDSVPGGPAAYGVTGDTQDDTTSASEVDQMQEEVEGSDDDTDDTASTVNRLIAEPYVSDIQYMNTTQATMTLQGTEEELQEFLDDIAKHYPAIQVRSMQATQQTYVGQDLKAVNQLDITCTLAVYTCGDKNHEEVTTDENES